MHETINACTPNGPPGLLGQGGGGIGITEGSRCEGYICLIRVGMCIRRGNQPAEYLIDVRRLGAPTEG